MNKPITKIIRQGSVDFSVSYKVQTTWGFQEALTFALEGMGAAIFFISFLFGQLQGALLGLVLLMASGALLLAHLGSPKNMIYVMANFRHSWMSRGAVMIPIFIALGLIVVAALWFGVWSMGETSSTILTGMFFLLAVFVLLKSGLVMTTFPAIAFWNSRLLPLLFALNGLASGAALFAVYPGRVPVDLFWVMPAILALLLITLMVYLSVIGKAGKSAGVSINLLSKRHFLSFYVLGIFVGTVLPFILSIHIMMWPSIELIPLLTVSAFARIVGDLALRHVILKVGVYDKVL